MHGFVMGDAFWLTCCHQVLYSVCVGLLLVSEISIVLVGFDFVDDAMRRDEGIFTLSRVRYCMSIRRSVVVVFCFFFENTR